MESHPLRVALEASIVSSNFEQSLTATSLRDTGDPNIRPEAVAED
jgi:hypothetical protein